MYRQVLVHQKDRDFQRILWWFSFDEPVREYRLNTVTYGQACASYLAIRCLRQLAIEGSEWYPLASRTLLNDVYVDDIITGADTVESARTLREQLTCLRADSKRINGARIQRTHCMTYLRIYVNLARIGTLILMTPSESRAGMESCFRRIAVYGANISEHI